MGTVLSFSPREKNPPYAVVDYGSVGSAHGVGHQFNNNKQEVVGNGVTAAKSNEKSAKKHSIFLNALNWKKFSTSASIPPSSSKSNKKQQQQQQHQLQQQQTAADKTATAAAMASRQFNAAKGHPGFPQVRVGINFVSD